MFLLTTNPNFCIESNEFVALQIFDENENIDHVFFPRDHVTFKIEFVVLLLQVCRRGLLGGRTRKEEATSGRVIDDD